MIPVKLQIGLFWFHVVKNFVFEFDKLDLNFSRISSWFDWENAWLMVKKMRDSTRRWWWPEMNSGDMPVVGGGYFGSKCERGK